MQDMEIKTEQESSPAWEKCVPFNVFLCFPIAKTPPKWELGLEASD